MSERANYLFHGVAEVDPQVRMLKGGGGALAGATIVSDRGRRGAHRAPGRHPADGPQAGIPGSPGVARLLLGRGGGLALFILDALGDSLDVRHEHATAQVVLEVREILGGADVLE